MEKKRYRTDDGVEVKLRRFASVIRVVGRLIATALFVTGFIFGILSLDMAEAYSGESGSFGTFLLTFLPFVLLGIIIWFLESLVRLVLTYITDMHYYQRTQMELMMESMGIELTEQELQDGEWRCSVCGCINSSDKEICSCGQKKPATQTNSTPEREEDDEPEE